MKKLPLFLAIFVMVFGFSLLSNIGNVFAAQDDAVCEPTDVDPALDCNGACDSIAENGSDDCNGSCERQDTPGTPDCDGFCAQGDVLNAPDCDGFCAGGDDACGIDCDPLGQCAFGQESQLTSQDVRTVTARIINVILTLLGTVATVIILIGGFKWMTAGGNDDKIGESKKLMAA